MNMSTATQKGPGLESFGARLKRERERQNMTLASVASATKIGTRLLQALEDEKFDRLPGGIFNKGFVRAYARHLGLDEEQAIADYLAVAGGAPLVKEPEAVVAAIAARKVESRPEKQTANPGEFPWGRITIILLLLAVGLVLWGSHSRKSETRGREGASPTRPPASTSAPAPSATSSTTQNSSAASANPPGKSSGQALPADSPGSFSVLIQARQDSWLSITVDDNQTASQLLAAGSQKSIAAHERIVIKAGNAGGLVFSFNGMPLPVQGGQDEVRVLSFDSHGLRSSVAKASGTSAPVQAQP